MVSISRRIEESSDRLRSNNTNRALLLYFALVAVLILVVSTAVRGIEEGQYHSSNRINNANEQKTQPTEQAQEEHAHNVEIAFIGIDFHDEVIDEKDQVRIDTALGYLLGDNPRVHKDVNKAIQILQEVASQPTTTEFAQAEMGESAVIDQRRTNAGVARAEYLLGKIFLEAEYVPRNLNLAYDYFSKSAQKGNTDAQFELGFFYSNGIVVERNEAMALLNYAFSGLAGNPNSLLVLGYRHMYGYSTPKVCEVAASYYTIAAKTATEAFEKGTLSPMSLESIRINDEAAMKQKQSEEDVMEYYDYSAVKGDVHAQLVMGYANLYGMRGIAQNPDAARRYFERAAQQGEPTAFGPLGHMYSQGMGVPQNNETALKYFKKGAELGDPASHNGLGYMYMYGLAGLPQDYVQAARHFNIAAVEGNNPEAQYNLGVLYMNGFGVPKSYSTAFNFMLKASQQGQMLANYQLGIMYLEGLGIPKSCPVAVKYLKMVAERGPWGEQMEKAYESYIHGDYSTALLRYIRMAEQGYEVAQSNAAYMLDRGLGLEDIVFKRVPTVGTSSQSEALATSRNAASLQQPEQKRIDQEQEQEASPPLSSPPSTSAVDQSLDRFERALHWYTRASQQGNVEAFVKVGDYYYYGLGTDVSFENSVKNYQMASNFRNPQATFNLGYMHEHGKGLDQDFHLAKRYYDMAAEIDSTARVPVLLALGKLYLHWVTSLVMQGKISSIFSLPPLTTTTPAGTPTSTSHIDSIIQQQQQAAQQQQQQQEEGAYLHFRRDQGLGEEGEQGEAYEEALVDFLFSEDGLLALCVLLLLVLLVFRFLITQTLTRRYLYNPNNQQQQQQRHAHQD